MKNNKFLAVVAIVVIALIACVSFVACNDKDGDEVDFRKGVTELTFSAPEGTPALAMLRLVTDNEKIDGTKVNYKVVKPANIASEMASKNSDLVIMPVNAGANLIRQGADYKLVGVAVDGSLYMVGKTEKGGKLTIDDIKGKKIACIGKTGVPGLVFGYVMSANGIEIVDENTAPSSNQISVRYVADGPAARVLLADGNVDFAVVGEPAATAFKGALKLNAEMDMQEEYSKASGASNYAQAGLFVRSGLAKDTAFMNALFDALSANKTWINANPSEVSAFASEHLYEGATFPAPSIARCKVNATKLDDTQKSEILTFLAKVMPKDAKGNDIDWQACEDLLF